MLRHARTRRFNLPSPKEGNQLLLGSTLALALLAFLGVVGCCVVELLEVGEAGRSSQVELGGSSKLVALGAACLQSVSILASVVGFCQNSSLAYLAGAVLTIVNTSVATAAIISEIADENTSTANNRYAALGAVYFFLGFLSGSFSLLATIRAEVISLLPTVFTEVDAQTANMLNILVPQR